MAILVLAGGAADIGYVMMQLKREPFDYYWQECVAPQRHPPAYPHIHTHPSSYLPPFLGGKYDLDAMQRDPERAQLVIEEFILLYQPRFVFFFPRLFFSLYFQRFIC